MMRGGCGLDAVEFSRIERIGSVRSIAVITPDVDGITTNGKPLELRRPHMRRVTSNDCKRDMHRYEIPVLRTSTGRCPLWGVCAVLGRGLETRAARICHKLVRKALHALRFQRDENVVVAEYSWAVAAGRCDNRRFLYDAKGDIEARGILFDISERRAFGDASICKIVREREDGRVSPRTSVLLLRFFLRRGRNDRNVDAWKSLSEERRRSDNRDRADQEQRVEDTFEHLAMCTLRQIDNDRPTNGVGDEPCAVLGRTLCF